MTTAQRNDKVSQLMADLIYAAIKKDFSIDITLHWKLQQIFTTTSWGFREILLVIGIAKLLDPSYAPTSQLYKCKPRALYEGPIRKMLYEVGIPHRKSGPLNIAKATLGIDESWAAQRQPKDVAMVTVELTQLIEESSSEQVRNLLTALISMLLAEAGKIQELTIEVPAESNINLLSDLCFKLIDNVPASGNTPEIIVGQLLECYQEQIGSGIQVEGYKEGASTTSTTSKKPSDITEKSTDQSVLAAYEVTMKPFDAQRISDSADTVKQFIDETGQHVQEIIVICRESDVHPDAILTDSVRFHLATLLFRSITYQFYEIHEWIVAALSRLSPSNRARFYEHLNDYIAEPNTSGEVKRFWKQLHDEHN